MSTPDLTPEQLAQMRAAYQRWEEKRAELDAKARADRRGQKRRELSSVPATLRRMHDPNDPERPIYPRELAVSLARDYCHTHAPIPDYRQIRQEAGAVIHRIAQQQPEAHAGRKRDELFRLLNNAMPAALRPALLEWLEQVNQFATAREVAAFYIGYAAGQTQTPPATALPVEASRQRRRTAIRTAAAESLRLTLADDEGS